MTPEGDTTLHLLLGGNYDNTMKDAAMNKMVVLLLKNKGDPNIKNRVHKLPLHLALEHFFHRSAMSLLARGCDVVPCDEANALIDSHKVGGDSLARQHSNDHLLTCIT